MEGRKPFEFENEEQEQDAPRYANQAAEKTHVPKARAPIRKRCGGTREYEEKLAREYQKAQLLAQVRSGASWFYWIAGLSLANTILYALGSEWGFLSGLAITDFITAFVTIVFEVEAWYALIPNVAIALVFIGFGYLAQAHSRNWAFPVGMALYVLDGLLALWAQSWISLGFHALALFFLFTGFRASLQYRNVTSDE